MLEFVRHLRSFRLKDLRSCVLLICCQCMGQKAKSYWSLCVCIGNHMTSSAIWDKLARRVNFSKTNQIARAGRASAICSL